MAKLTTPPAINDRMDLLNPATGQPYATGTVAQIHTIGERINSYNVRRDTGINVVVRPDAIRKK